MNFPAGWPPSCPPPEAIEADGSVFRLVKNNPPEAADFLSHHETGKLKKAPACLRCGLSVFRTLTDAVHQREALPHLGDYIAEGTLERAHGKTMLTPGKQPTHTTWWAYDGVARESAFKVVQDLS